jgi:hypothetical protein
MRRFSSILRRARNPAPSNSQATARPSPAEALVTTTISRHRDADKPFSFMAATPFSSVLTNSDIGSAVDLPAEAAQGASIFSGVNTGKEF